MTKTLGEQIYEYVNIENKKGNYPTLDDIKNKFKDRDVTSNVKGMVQSYHDKAVFKKNAGNFKKGDPRLYLEEVNGGYVAH